jgi:membrane-bound ClpP family serine protease
MWVIAGVLLGLVVLSALIGFHVGPHAHVAAGVLGLLAACWLVVMAVEGRSGPVLWALLSADLVVSAGIGTMAWKALTTRDISVKDRHLVSLEGAEGVAVDDLKPDGIVRVNGETWSAVALNGVVPAGASVHVLRVAGVRLEVWGEESLQAAPASEASVAPPQARTASEARPEGHLVDKNTPPRA